MLFISSSIFSKHDLSKRKKEEIQTKKTLGIDDAMLKSNEYPAQWSVSLISGLIMEKPCYLESVDDPMVTGVWQWKCAILTSSGCDTQDTRSGTVTSDMRCPGERGCTGHQQTLGSHSPEIWQTLWRWIWTSRPLLACPGSLGGICTRSGRWSDPGRV